MSMLIKNCRLLYQGKSVTRNIYIEGSIIKKITNDIINSDVVINANNNFVLPGVIDPHVHMREPGQEHKEDFFTGSMAAAAGGVTTFLDMPNNSPPCTTESALNIKRKLASQKSLVNFGFHFGASTDNLEQIKEIDNVASVKIYVGSSTGNLLVNDDAQLYDIFSNTKLAVLHAENESLIQRNIKQYEGYTIPDIHADIRNNMVAATAVARALSIAKYTDAKLYFAHVSTRDELEILKNQKAYVEVAPHHLFFTKKELTKQDNYAKMNPPLRSSDDRDALWWGIKNGIVNTIGSDHAPHTIEEKEKEYWEAPAGVPGVETTLPLLLNEVNEGNITLPKIVELMSINPARIFKIKNKGMIKEGFDADLTIVDMDLLKRVDPDKMFSKCGWSPYDGLKLRGWPVMTIVNGNIVFEEGEINKNKRGHEVEFG